MSEIQIRETLKLDEQILNIKQFYKWESMEVSNDHQKQVAGERLILLKKHIDEITKQKNKVLKPIKDGIREFENMAKQALEPLQKIDRSIRLSLNGYLTAQRERIRKEAEGKRKKEIEEARTKAREHLKVAKDTGSTTAFDAAKQFQKNMERLKDAPLDTSQTTRLSTGTIGERTVWNYKIIDESKIPDEYWIIDEKKLTQIKRGYRKNPVQIPGVEFFEESNVSVGG